MSMLLGAWTRYMGADRFEAVRSQEVWWIHQVTSGVKLITTENIRESTPTSIDNNDLKGIGSLAFGIMA